MQTSRMSFYAFISCMILALSGCLKTSKYNIKDGSSLSGTCMLSDCDGYESISFENDEPNKVIPTITVWVHGTALFSKYGPVGMFYSPRGLKAIESLPKTYHMFRMAQSLAKLDAQRFPISHFYLFGWSGKLSFEAREIAAQELYDALCELAKRYCEMHGITPRFRLITHSHGGNVALNLVKVKKVDMPFVISELVLLACPVQERTKAYVKDSIFMRVYSLFSRGELLQVVDPQGLYKGSKGCPLFSKRVFPINKKLSQAEIRMYGRSILHVEFVFGPFVRKIPAMLDVLDCEKCSEANEGADSRSHNYIIIDLKQKTVRKKCRNSRKKIVLG